MNQATEFMEDAKGRQVPLSMIKPIDLARNDLVLQLVAQAKHVQTELQEFKKGAFDDVQAFVELSAEQYKLKRKLGGEKGNVSLVSFDGRFKVLRAVSESLVFDERLIAAKALIDECIKRWSEGSDDKIRVLINDAFRVDKAGEINTSRVLGLAKLNIKDDQWQQAMLAISESVQVSGSKGYIRIYERVGNTDKFEPISLDIAAV